MAKPGGEKKVEGEEGSNKQITDIVKTWKE